MLRHSGRAISPGIDKILLVGVSGAGRRPFLACFAITPARIGTTASSVLLNLTYIKLAMIPPCNARMNPYVRVIVTPDHVLFTIFKVYIVIILNSVLYFILKPVKIVLSKQLLKPLAKQVLPQKYLINIIKNGNYRPL